MSVVKSVPEMLREAADVYEERSAAYGDNYKRFGAIMMLLFPDGIDLSKAEAMCRFGIFVQVVSKVTRYAENFKRNGHPDSLIDISVYSQMLRELDAEYYMQDSTAVQETFEEE